VSRVRVDVICFHDSGHGPELVYTRDVWPEGQFSDARRRLDEFLDAHPEFEDDDDAPPELVQLALEDATEALRDMAKGHVRGANGRRLRKVGEMRLAEDRDGLYVSHLLRCRICEHTRRIRGDELLGVLRRAAATQPVPVIRFRNL